jgi:hypothetical protein
VALVRTDVSEEHLSFIIRVKTISEPETTLAVTSDTFLRNVGSHEEHGVTSQKTVFFRFPTSL